MISWPFFDAASSERGSLDLTNASICFEGTPGARGGRA